MNPIKKIWITWESQRRTIELARLLPDLKLFILQLNAPRFVRYPYLILKTLGLLVRYRPKLLFVQNPSIVLTLSVVLLRGLFRFHLVVDAHNEGVKPFYPHHNWLLPLYIWIQKRADLTIVTNAQLAKEVASNGGTPFIMEDPIPRMKPTDEPHLKGKFNVVFICTFEKDEPYREVIASTQYLDLSICIYITGKFQKAGPDIVKQPPVNVLFCGYLSDQDYINLLHTSDFVMDLTLMNDCLVCGAYEAVALKKPMILSDTLALRRYFWKGAVYTQNKAQSIAMSVYEAIENKQRLEKEVTELRQEIEADWNLKYENLLNRLKKLCNS